jgi:hypothetical protein
VWDFNLPKGEYFLEQGHIAQAVQPVEYKLATLPPRDRMLKNDPETFPVIYTDNKFTGSVYWDAERSPYGKCVIVFDKSLRNLPLPEQRFIYLHECGHRFWDTGDASERACDEYASNRMLEEGYNPSQIAAAIIRTLSDGNSHRKMRIINSLTNK